MSRYLLSVINNGVEYSEEETGRLMAAIGEFNAKLRADGNWVFADGLEPPSSATMVDATGAHVVITDGPYLETKEHIGGFWIIEAADLDAALTIAADGSRACELPVEVRPFRS